MFGCNGEVGRGTTEEGTQSRQVGEGWDVAMGLPAMRCAYSVPERLKSSREKISWLVLARNAPRRGPCG